MPRFQFMDILYLLIPLSVVLVFLTGVLFWWSLKSGQFDDLEGPAHRILQDDDDPTLDPRREPEGAGRSKPGAESRRPGGPGVL